MDNNMSSVSQSDRASVDLDALVSGARLLEIVWDAQSKPSLQWLRKQVRCCMIPHIRRGRLVFFRPRSVVSWLDQKENFPRDMKRHRT